MRELLGEVGLDPQLGARPSRLCRCCLASFSSAAGLSGRFAARRTKFCASPLAVRCPSAVRLLVRELWGWLLRPWSRAPWFILGGGLVARLGSSSRSRLLVFGVAGRAAPLCWASRRLASPSGVCACLGSVPGSAIWPSQLCCFLLAAAFRLTCGRARNALASGLCGLAHRAPLPAVAGCCRWLPYRSSAWPSGWRLVGMLRIPASPSAALRGGVGGARILVSSCLAPVGLRVRLWLHRPPAARGFVGVWPVCGGSLGMVSVSHWPPLPDPRRGGAQLTTPCAPFFPLRFSQGGLAPLVYHKPSWRIYTLGAPGGF